MTAGPGVTNTISAIASAQANHSPMLVLGGRAPAARWGQGSLQEIDHVPLVAPLTKLAATIGRPSDIPALIDAALAAAMTPHGGPSFLDFPLDHVFSEGVDEGGFVPLPSVRGVAGLGLEAGVEPDGAAMDAALELLRGARRPVIMAGTDLYWGHGEEALRALAEELRIPVFLNGLARGCVPADHELFFSRARSRRAARAPTSRCRSARRWTSASASAARSASDTQIVVDRPRRRRRGATRARWRPSCSAT